MKKIFLVILVLISYVISNAQKVKTFFEYGINHNHAKEKVFYDNQKSVNYKSGIGANIGIKVVAKIDEHFDFKTGLYLNYNIYKLKYLYFYYLEDHQAYNYSDEYLYFKMPLLLSYNANKNIAFNIGTGLNINSSILNDNDYLYFKNLYDIPLNIGMTYRIKRTTFDIQYSMGNLPFAINGMYYWDTYMSRSQSYSTFFHRQLSFNIGHCLNRKSKTVWN